MLLKLRNDLRKQANSKRASTLKRFFKTGKGEYGEGDIFLGVTVPSSRKLAIKYKNLPFSDIKKLLQSKIHEERLIALLILVHNFQVGNGSTKKKIYNYYLKNTKIINNWDLVDLSAHQIMGAYIFDKPKNILLNLAKSQSIWERRISIISTYDFIRKNKFKETLKIAKVLLQDKHDLIHKAVGWMLREIGKRDQIVEEEFLKKNYKTMPRVMLRYAVERFPKNVIKEYLKS